MIAFKIAFEVAAGGMLGLLVVRGVWRVLCLLLLKLEKKRNAARDTAEADKIIASWRKLPERDSSGRFAKK